MKPFFTRLLAILLFVFTFAAFQVAKGQTGVLNPNDPVITYNSASPPAYPPANTLAKWVRTVRMSYNTNDFKCYFYNNVQFRLKFPTDYQTAPAGKTWPLYIFFHGVGERGSIYDNEFQLAHGGNVHQAAVNNGTFDGFLLYPQSSASSGGWSQAQIDAMATLVTNYLIPQVNVDPNRVIVSGLSGGGDAAWMFLESHPTIATAGAIFSSANISDISYVQTLKWSPIWLFQGGLDKSPDPSTTIQLVNAYNNAGGNLTYTVFPKDGHNTWDDAWKQPGYFPFLNAVNKQNPWPLTGRTQFCPTDNISVTMGVTAGLAGYQWRKNGSVIAGATKDSLTITSTGTYDLSVLRNGVWSSFSPAPVVISLKAATVPPTITVNGLASSVLPAPDGSTSVSLMVPPNYVSYVWQRVDSPATLSSTTNILTGATPGQYTVTVKEQYGCNAPASNPFTVIKTAGPNPPAAPYNLLATTLSKTQIRLNWSEVASQTYPETQFEIYQATSGTGPYKLVGFAPAFTDSFVATNLAPKTTFYYQVRAINNTAGSATTGPASAMTQADVTPPTAPGNLRTGTVDQTSVQLNWDASTDDVGVVAYDIYQNGNKISSIAGNLTTFTVYNLLNGTNYSFTVRARDLAGNVSPYSNQIAAIASFTGLDYNYYSGTWTTLPDFYAQTPVASGVVPNVIISSAQSTTSFGFMFSGILNVPATGSYTFQLTSVDGSKLYIDVPYKGAATTATVSNDATHSSKTVTGSAMNLTAGQHTFVLTYFKGTSGTAASVSVKWKTPSSGGAFVAIPNSAFIQTVSAAGATPVPPSNVTAVAATAKKINLSWTDNNSSNETGQQILRSTSGTGPFVAIATVKPGRASYSDSSLTPSTTYYYRIQAINQNGASRFNGQDSSVLTYNYYANYTASSLSGLSSVTPTSTGTCTNFSLGVTTATTNFALSFNGYINILNAGVYTFYLTSDDGSTLYIDGNLVVNNDGVHGQALQSGTANLSAGRHKIQVNYFQQSASMSLYVQYSGPGIPGTILIPDVVLNIPAVNATTLVAPPVPADPTGLTVSQQGPTHASLSWTNNASNAVGYQVYRSPFNNSNYLLAATLPASAIAYTDSNLTASTVYYYKVLAYNEGGNSNYSNEVNITTTPLPSTTVTLSNVPNQNIVNDSTVTVAVSASSSVSGLHVSFTSLNLPSFASLTDNGNGTATLSMRATSNQLGTYNAAIVTATDAYGGTASDTFAIVVGGKNQQTVLVNFNASNPAGAPWNSMNSQATTGASIINMKDMNGNATTENITITNNWEGALNTGIQTGNNSGVFPDNVMKNFYFGSTANPYTFKLTGLSASKKYSLVFFAGYTWTAAQQSSSGSLVANYTVGGQTVSLDAANNTTQTVQLSGLSADNTGTISVVVTKPSTSGYCLLSVLEVISYDAGSASALTPPSNLIANGVSGSSIQLSWTPSGDNRTGYEVWRSTSPGGSFSLLGTASASATSYADNGLSANSTYFYKVREVVSGPSYSAFSNTAGGSVVAYTVNLNLNSQSSFAQRAPWNNVNTVVANGFTLSNMMDMNFHPTGLNFNVVRNFQGFNGSVGETTGNNSGVVPDTVMSTFYYTEFGDSAIVSISGLSLSGIYNFGFFAGTTYNSATNTVFRIGGQQVSINALNNTTQMVWLYGLKPDSTGTVTINMKSTVGYGFLNSITVQGMPSADTIGADLLGTSGVIASSNRNGVQNGSGAVMDVTTPALNALVQPGGDLTGGAVKAFPNPFTDNVTLSFDFQQNIGKFTLAIVDAAGRIVYKREFDNIPAGPWQQSLNLSTLGRGTYFLELLGLPAGSKVQPIQLVKVKM